ncbi:SLC25A34 (predicted) [Pycnogonum litorale]
MTEFLLGGSAASAAGLFTNPLDVVKTRMQLQGELKARGLYVKHYKNVFHAFYTIGRYDGIFALQKGLGSAVLYQFFMNGIRLGTFQCCVNLGLTSSRHGDVSIPLSIITGACAGVLSAIITSPLYMACIFRIKLYNK